MLVINKIWSFLTYNFSWTALIWVFLGLASVCFVILVVASKLQIIKVISINNFLWSLLISSSFLSLFCMLIFATLSFFWLYWQSCRPLVFWSWQLIFLFRILCNSLDFDLNLFLWGREALLWFGPLSEEWLTTRVILEELKRLNSRSLFFQSVYQYVVFNAKSITMVICLHD